MKRCQSLLEGWNMVRVEVGAMECKLVDMFEIPAVPCCLECLQEALHTNKALLSSRRISSSTQLGVRECCGNLSSL